MIGRRGGVQSRERAGVLDRTERVEKYLAQVSCDISTRNE